MTDELDLMVAQVYTELHARAERMWQRRGGSIQPTSLVHEAFLKMAQHDPGTWTSELHFASVATKAMRQILIDRARRRATPKHGGDMQRVSLIDIGSDTSGVDAIDLERALQRLDKARPRGCEIVQLRLFGGLEIDEVAELLGISPSSVKREWRASRAWLISELR